MSAARHDEPIWGDDPFAPDGSPACDGVSFAGSSGSSWFGNDRGDSERFGAGESGDEWFCKGESGDGHRSSLASPAAAVHPSLEETLKAAAISSATPDGMVALARLDPDATPALTLVHGILACQRLASCADAVQQTLVAALARPGVAVPIERVIEAARWSNAKAGDLSTSDRALDAAADPPTAPGCAAVIAPQAARSASMEVGAALHLSPLTTRARVDRARYPVDELPQTLAAQRAGELDSLRARILVNGTVVLSPAVRQAIEASVLVRAGSSTPFQLRARLTRQSSGSTRKVRPIAPRPPGRLATSMRVTGWEAIHPVPTPPHRVRIRPSRGA